MRVWDHDNDLNNIETVLLIEYLPQEQLGTRGHDRVLAAHLAEPHGRGNLTTLKNSKNPEKALLYCTP
jgi:hypothetical protein